MKSLRLILSNSNYFAPAWVFASINIMTGTWGLYLSHVKNKFDLNDAEIGMALFSLAFGLLISIPYVNKKIGVGRSSKWGILLFALMFNFPLAATSYMGLCYFSVLGFGILGLGLSVIIPELFRLAGQTKNVPASEGIALVSGIGFIGFLMGAILLGFISNWSDLIMSYGFLTILVILAFLLNVFFLRNFYQSDNV